LPERYYQYTLPNGLTLLGEKMPGMQSAAMTLMVPAGAAVDLQGASGTATVLSDLVLRGAGERDSRQLTDYLDSLGLQRSSSAGVHHTRFTAAALAERVIEALPTYLDIVRRPHLPEPGFQAARDLTLQGLEGIEDEPRQKVLIKLRERYFPWPYGRNTMGEPEDLEALTLKICKSQHQKHYHANGSILAIAGNIDFDSFRREAERLFGDWPATPGQPDTTAPAPLGVHHVEHPSEQTHIGLAWPSIEEIHPDYYVLRLAMEVLSGGMSGRLFTEVREKRGLVYNVWAGYTSLKGFGSIMGYAGTSNDRAQATLDTFIDEVYRLSEGVTAAELDRAKIGLKAATIMQGESTSSRSGSIAHDFFMRGRIRTLDEIKKGIDDVKLDQVNQFLKTNKPGPFTIVTVGPKPLKTPCSASCSPCT
jgi:predicted Zn-dependent peptidase